jgi:hypothetical protein
VNTWNTTGGLTVAVVSGSGDRLLFGDGLARTGHRTTSLHSDAYLGK